MRYSIKNSARVISFSQLSKKGYAIFAGISKLVKIGRIAIHICNLALLKASKNGLLVNDSKNTNLAIIKDNIDESMYLKMIAVLAIGDNYVVKDDILNKNNIII